MPATPQVQEVVVEAPEPLLADVAPAFAGALARAGASGAPVRVSMRAVRRVDTFGLAALASGVRALRARGRTVQVVDLDPAVRHRADLLRLGHVVTAPEAPRPPRSPIGALLDRVSDTLDAWVMLAAMLQEGFLHALRDCLASKLGPEQLARQLDQVGARAVPIVAGVTVLIGAIMALQTAYVVEAYGGTPFVARGVAISMTREIGPLMAAVLVAGRSGSAIAAEVGSMVVYEEVDALTMMALAPRRFLLSPRFVALSFAVPALSILADVCGIIGGAVVMHYGYSIPWGTYYDSTVQGVLLRDIGSGLLKSVFFGALIAVVACRQGLSLRGGPEAVGRAATAAVVGGILAVVMFDAAFTLTTRRFL